MNETQKRIENIRHYSRGFPKSSDLWFLLRLVEEAVKSYAESLPGEVVSFETGKQVGRTEAIWKVLDERMRGK